MNEPSLLLRLTIPALLLLSGGCSTQLSADQFRAYLDDPKALRLAVQVCVPDKTAYFEELSVDVTDVPSNITSQELRKMFQEAEAKKEYSNPYKSTRENREFQTIGRWLPPVNNKDYSRTFIGIGYVFNEKGIEGASGGTADLSGSTDENQPVFNEFTHRRPTDILAVDVGVITTLNGKSDLIRYWFKPPEKIGSDGYTEWMAPTSVEHSENRNGQNPFFWLLTHGSEMPITPVDSNAPRVRFRLLTLAQHWDSLDTGRRAINMTKLNRLVSSSPVPHSQFHLVPAKTSSIPPC